MSIDELIGEFNERLNPCKDCGMDAEDAPSIEGMTGSWRVRCPDCDKTTAYSLTIEGAVAFWNLRNPKGAK